VRIPGNKSGKDQNAEYNRADDRTASSDGGLDWNTFGAFHDTSYKCLP